MGTERSDMGHRDEESMGIVPRFSNDLFRYVAGLPENQEMKMTITFMELYNEQIVDLLNATPVQRDPATGVLLNRAKLLIREDATGVNVDGLAHVPVTCTVIIQPNHDGRQRNEEILDGMDRGVRMRVTGATNMNENSSRSHAVFTIHIVKSNITKLAEAVEGQTEIRESTSSKIHFVDLAGSERLSKTGAQGKQMLEGVSINLGLLALGNVINTLADEKKRKQAEASGQPLFVPYRDSKLTRILQDSLGGNSKTLMLACASPAAYNQEETLTTLRYADRARAIKNKAVVNRDAVSEQIHNLKEQIKKLQVELVQEHFKVSGIEHGDCMTNPDYKAYMEKMMSMKVENYDNMGPSVFTDLQKNAQNKVGAAAKALDDEEEEPEQMITKDDLDKALAQIEMAQKGEKKTAPGSKKAQAEPSGGSSSTLDEDDDGAGAGAGVDAEQGGSQEKVEEVKHDPKLNKETVKNVNVDTLRVTLAHFEELQAKHDQLKMQQNKVNGERGQLLTHMSHMAALFDQRGDYEFALEMFLRAHSMKETSLGPDHPSVAGTLWSMAEVCGNRRDYNNALHLFQRALSTLEAKFGSEHKDIAILLNNIALVHSAAGNDDHALFCYMKALTLKTKLLGANNMSVSNTRVKMGKVFAKLHHYKDAMGHLEAALKIISKNKGEDSLETVEVLEEMAGICLKTSRGEDAIKYYTQVLEIREAEEGEDSDTLLESLNKLTMCYEVSRMYSEAHEALRKLLVIHEKASQNNASKEANAMLARATASGNAGAQKRAMEMYQDAMVEHREDTAAILGRMGAAAAQFDKKLGIEAYTRAVEIEENPLKDIHQRALDNLK